MNIAETIELPAHVPPELVGANPLRFGEHTTENPHQTLVPKAHQGPPAIFVPGGYHGLHPMWIFRRYQDVKTIYEDTEHFSSKDFAPFAEITNTNMHLVPAESDPPEHTFHRRLTNPLFAPKKMEAVLEQVRHIARETILGFRGKGECEFMQDMAFRFPIVVFLKLMGLPLENIDEYLFWERKLTHPSGIDEMTEGTRWVMNFLTDLIAERRKNPGSDLVSQGIAAQADGKGFSDDELLGFCFNLYVGGLDTVSTNMTLQFRHLAEHPEHQARLRQDPALIPQAVEELMRAYSAVTTTRRCIKPVVVGGVQVMPGDIIAMCTVLANRDPEQFPNPDVVDLDRKPLQLGFGAGVHRCVGSALARREMVVAIEEMLANLPEFRIKPGAEIVTSLGPIIQPVSLPLVWSVQ